MILSEKGVRKIVREVFKIRNPGGPEFSSSDPRYTCNLDSLRTAPVNSGASKLMFFLMRALYFNPVGMQKKSLFNELDRLATNGTTMTTAENAQYNESIKAMSSQAQKNKIVQKIETTLDVLFFPTAAPVCSIIDTLLKNVLGYDNESSKNSSYFDASSFLNALISSSSAMLSDLGLKQSPAIQILYPSTHYLMSKGADKDSLKAAYEKEQEYIQSKIMAKQSQDVDNLWLSIKRLHSGVSGVRNRNYYLSNLETYFSKLENDGYTDSISVSNKIKKEILTLILNNPIIL